MRKSKEVIEIYNKEYFLRQVDGCDEFSEFDGTFEALFPRYRRNIELLNLLPAHKLLEIGCGRGEVCIYHALRGGFAKGVDYSGDAINLAKFKANSLGSKANFVTASFDEIEEENDTYDRILASEFIEHISKEEGGTFFKSMYSMLKPNGKLLVFTAPNTFYRSYGYPVYRFLNALRGKKLPRIMDDTISEHYRLYHLNEQNYISLASLAREAGFSKFEVGYDIKKTLDQNESLINRIVKSLIIKTPFRHIFLNNLYIFAEK